MAFIPKTWVDDQIVYAEDMNRIEQGIADAVSVTSQTLDDSQKNQARNNIGAAPAGYGGFGEVIPHGGRFSDDSTFVTWLTNQINSIPFGTSKQIRFALSQEYSPYPFIFSGSDWYGVLTNEQGFGTLIVYSYSLHHAELVSQMVRNFYENAWQPWEWVNPPMDLGVEYRTTERYRGSPVYVKLVNFGAMPNNTLKVVTFGDNTMMPVSAHGIMSEEYVIPGCSGSDDYPTQEMQIFTSPGQVGIMTHYDRSGQTALVIVKYWKKTN